MKETFIFFRKEGWYSVEIPREDVMLNVELNPSTIRVEDIDGNIIWEDNKEDQ